MKTLITTLNSKYIHTSLSLRLLYVASYHRFDVDFKEYTIKDSLEHIVDDLLSMHLDMIAFSCYIWNIEYIDKLCHMLRQRQPDIILALGGPEVTYEPQYFLEHIPVDYILSGEGEEIFPQLLEALEKKQDVCLPGVSYRGHISSTVAVADLKYVESLDSPYCLPQDQKDMSKRILYFETSRGCPFQCQYCLSSLEKGLRFFSLDYLKEQLQLIINSGVKTIKLLDRSFNAKTSHALAILEFVFKNAKPGMQFQFEINGDVLDQKIIDYINDYAPDGLLRFEIGIQSTYDPTNEIVRRYQDFNRLSEVIRQLQSNHKIDFHLDLIAGLPLENLSRFAKSFDDVFAFRPKELQLGFLKLLRGTSLRNEANKYGYVYDSKPPYELIESNDLSKEDIKKIHLAEEMLEKFWNSGKMPITMNKVMDNVSSPFYFFMEFGKYYLEHDFKLFKFQNDELFSYLNQYLNYEYEDLLIEDYLRLTKVKPKRWWKSRISKQQSRDVMHQLVEKYHLDQEELFRYGLVEKLDSGYIVAIYKNYHANVKKYLL